MNQEQQNNNHERWNVFSLKEYMDYAMTTLDEKFMTITKKDEEAVKTARDSMEHRLDAVNEFKEQLNDQANSFLKREIYDANHKLIEQKIEGLSRLVYVGVGICVTLELIFKFLK